MALRTIVVVAALAAVPLVAGAQTSPVDPRWAPYVGCWQLRMENTNDGIADLVAAAMRQAPANQKAGDVMVCIAPSDQPQAVTQQTVLDGESVLDEIVLDRRRDRARPRKPAARARDARNGPRRAVSCSPVAPSRCDRPAGAADHRPVDDHARSDLGGRPDVRGARPAQRARPPLRAVARAESNRRRPGDRSAEPGPARAVDAG